ncbi:TIGR01244 family phosphatase [Stakelama sp. CBK3Z-3]|uniref:TIGR01244 family phosphatase n=1 Tax=Stakelama flava TaxID=2860338 RepID=A0ABS6XME8_9SPHN|nr:TIGR01244 family sulfur transferase [Stakelama flava]MBW4331341.1 TIGR01244 family phosphatase [Stakelama flava]
MATIRRIDERISVAPQIDPADIGEIAQAGFTTIINNRPDEEEAGQPEGDAIRADAEALGLGYNAIPITHAGFSHAQIDAMRAALDAATGPVLAYCRSGTRSANLWALASAKAGGDPETIIAQAAGAGYDLSAIRPLLDSLSADA